MDWDKLRIFHAAAEAGSFTHAGEHLRMSQSAVSRQVSALERELNVVGDPRIKSPDPLHVNVGRFRAGDWGSSVPSVARLDVRVGFPPGWTPAKAAARR